MKRNLDERNDLSHLAKCLYRICMLVETEKTWLLCRFFTLHLCISCVCISVSIWVMCTTQSIQHDDAKNNKKEIPHSNSCIWWNEKQPIKRKKTHTHRATIIHFQRIKTKLHKNIDREEPKRCVPSVCEPMCVHAGLMCKFVCVANAKENIKY